MWEQAWGEGRREADKSKTGLMAALKTKNT